MLSNRTLLGLCCILAGVLYFIFFRPESGGVSPLLFVQATPTPEGPITPTPPMSVLVGDRVLHHVKVLRCDPDGFVVSSSEGTLKVWNQQITPAVYAQLKRATPLPTPTPKATPASSATPGLSAQTLLEAV